MTRGDSTGVNYVGKKFGTNQANQEEEDPLEEWMNSVATSLKVDEGQYTFLKS